LRFGLLFTAEWDDPVDLSYELCFPSSLDSRGRRSSHLDSRSTDLLITKNNQPLPNVSVPEKAQKKQGS
jgi:hypothetical protein